MSTNLKVSRVQKKGQVTIPIEIRDRLGIQEGDFIAFVETPEGVFISRQEIAAMRLLNQIGQALKDKGISLDELIESGRELRGEMIKEKYDLIEQS